LGWKTKIRPIYKTAENSSVKKYKSINTGNQLVNYPVD